MLWFTASTLEQSLMNNLFTACLLGALTIFMGCSGQKSPASAPTGGAAAFGGAGGSGGGGDAGGSTGLDSSTTHWVGTWTASPYPVPSGNMPPASLSNSVLRQ